MFRSNKRLFPAFGGETVAYLPENWSEVGVAPIAGRPMWLIWSRGGRLSRGTACSFGSRYPSGRCRRGVTPVEGNAPGLGFRLIDLYRSPPCVLPRHPLIESHGKKKRERIRSVSRSSAFQSGTPSRPAQFLGSRYDCPVPHHHATRPSSDFDKSVVHALGCGTVRPARPTVPDTRRGTTAKSPHPKPHRAAASSRRTRAPRQRPATSRISPSPATPAPVGIA